MSEQTRSAAGSVDVTPSDTTVLAEGVRSLYVGTGGTVVVRFPNGTVGTHRNVQSGSVLPVQARRVLSTGTTASDILAYY